MEDLTKRASEVDQENSAFDALMLRLGRTLNYDSGPGLLEDVDLDSSQDQDWAGINDE
jgi:hypothetical protein